MSTPSTESVPEDVRDELARCHARLEIDHAYKLVGGEFEEFTIPMEERPAWPDAVTCRDATIQTLEEHIAKLEHYHNHFRSHAKVSPSGAKAYDTAKEEWEKRMREA